ncbi:hypothetical protein VPNG_08111 [Cytospora leucostoma]|uniref:Nephrocystin 3-like N-terminal domain-containing protein n=1 Tax=Cytospora leucostoma TaxID=1230097 RepID=A0A423WS27_9PEZI|nr:hypothetical protein VPNG_08111 [Cytospora leucostoma]
MEDNDQVVQVSVGEHELDQDRSDNVKEHEGTQSANSDDGFIDDENTQKNTATVPGDLPKQSQNHPTTPEDPGGFLTEYQTLESKSVAGSDVESLNHGLIVENEGGAEFDVVMVHGLGQDRRSAWIDDTSAGTTWMERAYPTARILLYGYNTNPDHSGIFTTNGIVNEATRLLYQLDSHRRDNLPKRSLVFMSHGLGGLLVKAVLILASRLPEKYAYILEETTCLVFMGYSIGHKPSSVPVLQEQILALLLQDFGKDKYMSGRLMSYVHSLTQTVQEVHDNFVHTKMFVRAVIVNGVPQAFDESAADELLQRSDAFKRTPYEPGTWSLYNVKFSDMTHIELGRNYQYWPYGNLDETDRKVLNDFISQAPPFYPSRARIGPDSVSELDELSTLRGSRILHMRCDADTRLMTDYVWEYLKSRPIDRSVLRFQSNPHDVRFASLDAMVRAFLSQLAAQGLVQREWSIERMISYITTLRAWTARDLLFPLSRFISSQQSGLVFVIGGLDECEGPIHQFIEMANRIQRDSDVWVSIVILTTACNDSSITKMLSDLPGDSLQGYNVDPKVFFMPEDEQTRFDLRMLFQKHPQYMRNEISSALAQVFSTLKMDHNHSLSHLILSWLESTRTPIHAVKRTLELLQHETLTPERVFGTLLLSVPQEKQKWAKQLLRWVAFSVRPLRVEELCLVSQLTSPQNGGTTVADILCWLSGVLHVEYDEVHFAHTEIRPWLVREAKAITVSTGDGVWCHFRAEDACQDHLDILNLCSEYIHSPDGQSVGGIWPTKHVFPYAWQHWTTHYCLAKESAEFPSAREKALAIFRNNAMFRRWIDAYRDLADPITLFDSQALTPISIAAHFGLDDLLELLTGKANSDWAVLPPLIEAARRGHLSTIKLLKQRLNGPLPVADYKVGRLVEAAASCGQAEVLQEVLTLIPKTKAKLDFHDTKPAWLSSVLIQACWIDNKDLAGVVLNLGADMNAVMPPPPAHSGVKTPTNTLSVAIMANSIDTMNLLLDRDYDLKGDATITRALADWGTREMAELLIKKGWDFKSHLEDGETLLQRACSMGRPAVLDVVLEHEPNFAGYIDPVVGGEPLLLAVKDQHFKTVQTLLKHGVNINVADDEGNALYHAVECGNVGLCNLLLKHEKDKIDVNYCAPNSRPPLVHAILSINERDDSLVQIVKLLLGKRADVRKTEGNGWGRTPLLAASALQVPGIEEVISLLLKSGSEVDARDSDGWTSLYTAATFNTVDVGRLLIAEKADLYATTKEGNRSPLHGAYEKPDFIELLLEHGVNPMQKYDADVTPLQMCARENLTKSLEIMLEGSYDSEEAALTDALVDAFDNFHEGSVRLLLNHGASVNLVQEHTNMPLISRAMQSNHESMLRLLLEYRPELDLVDNAENTALHYIDDLTTVASVKSLVNATAKIDVLNRRKQSPLMVAVESRNWDVVRYLVSKPAILPTLNVPTYLGTPLHRACRLGTLNIVKCLIERGADPDISCEGLGKPLSQACIRLGYNYAAEKEDMIRYILEKSDSALAPASSESAGPMHYAALTCSAAINTLFIDKGADKFTMDDMGRRPLHLACYNSLEVVQTLNMPDGEFAARDKVGRVPLHYAVMAAYSKSETPGSPSLLEYVLEKTKAAGLGVDVTDNDGWTPLLWSARDSTVFEWGDDDRPQFPLETFQKLVDNEANPAALGQVRRDQTTSSSQEEQWSLMDIAAYHDNAILVDHLANTIEKLPGALGKAPRRVGIAVNNTYCDCCYLRVYGEHFECVYCLDLFCLCFKCYGSKDALHPAHDFVRKDGDMDDGDEQAGAQTIVDDAIAVEDSEHDDNVREDNSDHEAASELSSDDLEMIDEAVSVTSKASGTRVDSDESGL